MSNLHALTDKRVRSSRSHDAGTPLGREGATGMKRRTRVYVAGPMTGSGNPYANIWRGLDVAMTLIDKGYAPYVPHLTCILEMTQGQRDREVWLGLDKAFLLTCDTLLRLNGVSPGADEEVGWAIEAGISVHYSLDMLLCCEASER